MADQVRASARFVRQAPYKVRQVVDLVRGMGVGEAQRLLAFSRRSAAKTISKLLKSAVANAEETGKLDVDSLFVARMKAVPMPSKMPESSSARVSPRCDRNLGFEVVCEAQLHEVVA